MNTTNNKEKVMKKDFVLQSLENIDILLTKISYTDENRAIALQRDIIRALDSCLEHIENTSKQKKVFTCAHYFQLINKINKDVNEQTEYNTDPNCAIYEAQKNSIMIKVRKVRNKLLPSAIRLAG